MNKPSPARVHLAACHFVAAELLRRGARSVVFPACVPGHDVDVVVGDSSDPVPIRVKAKRSGSWQYALGPDGKPQAETTHFWIFVDVHPDDAPPEYFVVPTSWIIDDIRRTHRAYLDKHGGQRARTPSSRHHAISIDRIERWRDGWNTLGLLG